MSANQNIEVVTKLFNRIDAVDTTGALEAWAPDLVVHIDSASLLGGDYHGHAGMIDLVKKVYKTTGGTNAQKLVDVGASDGYAYAYVLSSATREGKSLVDGRQVWIYRMQDGKIQEAWSLGDGAVNDFWT